VLKNKLNRDKTDLYKSFSKLNKVKDVKLFLNDLLGKSEIEAICDRLLIAKEIKNHTPKISISKDNRISKATIAKVQYVLDKGGNGYKIALNKLES